MHPQRCYISIFIFIRLKLTSLAETDLYIPSQYGCGTLITLWPQGFKGIIIARKDVVDLPTFHGNLNKIVDVKDTCQFGKKMKRATLNSTHYRWEYTNRITYLCPGDILSSVIQFVGRTVGADIIVTIIRNVEVLVDGNLNLTKENSFKLQYGY